MKIGIVEAGAPPASLEAEFGSYVSMTRHLLGQTHEYVSFRVFDGHMPEPRQCEAFVITGSASSVYENHSWIAELETFLRSARGHSKLVGICFGHQIMAQAFGGRVEKAQGWGLGLHRYDICERAIWMDDADAVHATASHQDQVTTLPPDSRVLGASAFTPYAILSYKNHPAISVQFHPEFDPAFSRALFATRRTPNLSEDEVNQAINSMSAKNDNSRIGRWMNNFLRG